LRGDGKVVGWGGANVPADLPAASAVSAGSFGMIITRTEEVARPELEITWGQNGQALVRTKTAAPGFLLESSDRPDSGFGPAPQGIYLDQLIPPAQPRQYFRLRKPL
jgi:hypothetical protein